MIKNYRSAGVKVLLTLLATTASSQALAQTTDAPIPPVRSPLDERGVNLATGQVELSSTDLTIGNEQSGLSFTRYWNGGTWRHDYIVGLYSDGTNASVFIGDRTVSFDQSGNSFTSRQKDGSTLAPSASGYIYTAADGTVITFDNVEQDTNYYGPVSGTAASIRYPSGEEQILDYKTDTAAIPLGTIPPQYLTYPVKRLQSVRNNLGLQLKFTYASNSAPSDDASSNDWYRLTRVTAINNAIEICAPTADACSLSQSWEHVDYAKLSATQETKTDALGHMTRYTTDGGGSNAKIVAIRAPRSNDADTTSYSYTNDKVSSVSNGQASWNYTWAGTGSQPQVTITDPLSHTNVVTTDVAQGVITSSQDALGRVSTFNYDANGRLQSQVIPGGGTVHYHRDDRGNVYELNRLNEDTTKTISTYASYPSTCANVRTCNKPTSTTDGDGKVTNYEYDPNHGGVTKVTLPSPDGGSAVRPEMRYTYDLRQAAYKDATGTLVLGSGLYRLIGTSQCMTGGPSCANTADEQRTTYTYGFGNGTPPTNPNNLYLTQVSSGAGDGSLSATVGYGYDRFGNRNSVDGPLAGSGDTSYMFYDDARQQTKMVSPNPGGDNTLLPRAVRYERNPDGQVTDAIAGTDNSSGTAFSELQRTVATYDALGRKTSDKLRMGGVDYAFVQYGYDSANRPTCTAQRMTQSRFGAQSDPCALDTMPGVDGQDRISKLSYYNDDQVHLVQSALGTGQQQDTQTLTYNATSGQLETVTDARSNKTTYEYDGFLRPLKTRYPTASTGSVSSSSDYEQLTYNDRGLVTNLRTRDAQNIGLGYDDIGRLKTRTSPSGTGETNVTYNYDNLGRLTSAVDNAGLTLTRGWDALGRMRQEGTTGLPTLTFDYDLADRRIYQTWGDGSSTNWDYLSTGELWRVRENGAVSGVGVLAVYGYDNLGRRKTLTRGNGTSTFLSYGQSDTQPWLSSLTQDLTGSGDDLTRTFTRSVIGDIRQATSSNDSYRYTGFANLNRGYTSADGLNRYSGTNTGDSFYYDGRGNLTSWTVSGQSTLSYGYTADNRLVTASGGNFRYDPFDRLYHLTASNTRLRYGAHGELVGEFDASGNYLRRYVHGDAGDEALVWYEGSSVGDRRHLHADERGSIVAVSNASGTAQYKLSYDEHGVPGPNNAGRFQYTGQTWLAEIGAYNYKARIYSPTLGRFLQTDPVGYADHMNLYAYGRGDPANSTDPSGLDTCLPSDPICVTGARPSGPAQPTLPTWWLSVLNGISSPAMDGGTRDLDLWNVDDRDREQQCQNGGGRYTSGSFQGNAGACLFLAADKRGGVGPSTGFGRPGKVNPLDPRFMNKPLTPRELRQVSNTLNLLVNGDTRQVMSTLHPHDYVNRPSVTTGAVLPYSSSGYTVIDVIDSGRGGSQRIIFNNSNYSMYYTNTHYDSFYYWGIGH